MKTCNKCGGSRFFPKGGCYYCGKERQRLHRLKKGKKPRQPKPKKYCAQCDKKTEHGSNDRCKTCAERYLSKCYATQYEIEEIKNCRQNNIAFLLFNKSFINRREHML